MGAADGVGDGLGAAAREVVGEAAGFGAWVGAGWLQALISGAARSDTISSPTKSLIRFLFDIFLLLSP
jgi:hypothetical protein